MRKIPVIVILFILSAGSVVQALDTSTRPVGPARNWRAEDLARFDHEWLHLKFVEGSDALLQGESFRDDSGLDLTAVNAALSGTQLLEIRRTFTGERDELRALKAVGEAASGVTGPDLSLWFDLRVAGGAMALAELINELNASDAVEIAHPAPICETAVIHDASRPLAPLAADPNTPDFTDMQEYLYDPPVGLDAPAAWAWPGGTGADMKFIDVELAWVEDHEDYNYDNFFYHGGANEDNGYLDHGTAVLGEVIGQDNGYGVNGFAPDVQYGVVAITVNEWPNVPHYFQEAVDNLDEGDVWLIELQMYPPETNQATPMEYVQANYDVIWTGVFARGVVCVEAGANGSQNLDAPVWDGLFNRHIRDSGAIMVGAGTPNGRVAEWFTNYGSRMDVHAWGSEIVTTGYGDLYNGGSPQTEYTGDFGGTSGASPMVTGSSLCLQGIARHHLNRVLHPIELRTILNETGVPHLDTDQEIGPRPDLEEAALAVINLTAAPGEVARDFTLTGLPNPFSSSAEIRFALPADAEARLSVFDLRGRKLREIIEPAARAGENLMVWDGRDDAGRDLSSGVYFFRLEAGDEARQGRLVKVR